MYLGFSLCVAYSFIYIHDAATFTGSAGLDQSYLVFYLATLFIAKGISFLIGALVAYRHPQVGSSSLITGAAILLAVGVIVITILFRIEGLSFGIRETLVLLALAGTSLGIGDALMILVWGRFASTLSLKSTYIFVLSSYLVALLFYLILIFLPPLVLAICTLFTCLFLPMMTKRSMVLRPQILVYKPNQVAAKNAVSTIWRPVLLTAIFAFISNFTLIISDHQSVDPSIAQGTSFVFTLGVVLVMLIPALVAPRRVNIGMAYRVALPLAAGGLLLFALFSQTDSGISNSMVAMGWLLADLVAWCVIANSAARTRIPAFILFGGAHFVFSFASLAGTLTGNYFYSALDRSSITLMTIALVGMYALVTALAFLIKDRRLSTSIEETEEPFIAEATEKEFHEKTHAENPAPPLLAPHTTAEEVYVFKDRFQEKIQNMSKQAHLTPRESEVLRFLAQGRSTQYMADSLFVSENTVKSHVKNIYQKLKVHSKQEIIDIINSEIQR